RIQGGNRRAPEETAHRDGCRYQRKRPAPRNLQHPEENGRTVEPYAPGKHRNDKRRRHDAPAEKDRIGGRSSAALGCFMHGGVLARRNIGSVPASRPATLRPVSKYRL